VIQILIEMCHIQILLTNVLDDESEQLYDTIWLLDYILIQ
jgi:hypothetical protein